MLARVESKKSWHLNKSKKSSQSDSTPTKKHRKSRAAKNSRFPACERSRWITTSPRRFLRTTRYQNASKILEIQYESQRTFVRATSASSTRSKRNVLRHTKFTLLRLQQHQPNKTPWLVPSRLHESPPEARRPGSR